MRWLVPFVTLVAAGCTSPCELDRLPDCPDCGPGEIRHGVSAPFDEIQSPPPVVTGTPASAACVACDALHRFDAAGVPRDTVSLDDGYDVEIAPDGSIYTLTQYSTKKYGDDDSLDRTRLRAYAPEGTLRWTTELGELVHTRKLVAGDEGAYVVYAAAPNDLITAYAAADGAKRWSESGELPVPDGNGGVLLFARQGGFGTATITAFDAAHAQRWRHTLTARSSDVEVAAAHASADGIAIAGRFGGSALDLGGMTVTPDKAGPYSWFVASFDAQGTPRWGHAILDGVFVDELSVTTVGDTLVAGARYVGESGTLGLPSAGNGSFVHNGFIAAFDAQGLLRMHAFSGDGYQAVRSVADAGDGSVWATLDTQGGFTLGDKTYTGDQTPRRSLINVVP